MRRLGQAMAVLVVLVVSAGFIHAGATPAEKCAVAKNKAAAKKASSKLKCWQKAIAAGLPAADSTCLSAAHAKFHDAIVKAESPGACAVTGDESNIENAVDACVTSIVSLTPATTTTTTSTTTSTLPGTCSGDSNCPTTDYCDPATQTCLFGCRLAPGSCGSPGLACDPSHLCRCALCDLADLGSPHICVPGGPTTFDQCVAVQCVSDGDCLASAYCDVATNVCVTGCRVSPDNCSGGLHCNSSTHVCM